MEKIALIDGDIFIYWSPAILALAALAAICFYASVYLKKDGNLLALGLSVLSCVLLSLPLSRLVHWYCRTPNYESLNAAMTDYSSGGFALIGVFAACLITACVLRLLRISKNLPTMLDSMSIGGGIGIVIGRLASLFNSSDRGMILPDDVPFPYASPIINSVSGVQENRLATFMMQSILTGGIVVVLLLYMAWRALRKKKIRDGDICLMFLLGYGSTQIICDSTRYDSLFLRSNGFVSVVQILGLVALLVPMVLFSIRMVKHDGKLKPWHFPIWLVALGLLGMTGYMEYYVQRNGHKAALAYSVMGACLASVILLGLTIRWLSERPKKEAAAPAKC